MVLFLVGARFYNAGRNPAMIAGRSAITMRIAMGPSIYSAPDTPSKEDTCSNCAYLLRGLGERGRCPECGAEFSPERVVVWSALPKSHRYSTSISITVGAIVAAMGIAIVILLPRERALSGIECVAFATLPTAIAWYVRHGRQLCIGKEGFGSRIGYGRVGLTPWRSDTVVMLQRFNGMAFVLSIRREKMCMYSIRLMLSDPQASNLYDRLVRATGREIALVGLSAPGLRVSSPARSNP
ncbi:MAG TPA: hypothetical protein VHM90_17105 [Phycisphaerae bacterium]|nr:hypothetical protein [Phycisphaerae bacterium]